MTDNHSTPLPARFELPFESWAPFPPQAPQPPPRRRLRGWPLAALLFFLTFLTTTTIGSLWSEAGGLSVERPAWVSPTALLRVWSHPDLLFQGLAFSLPTLFILFCHEMGHYLACRYYRLPVTPPYFLPVPIGLGTFGAFIRIRAPLRLKRQLFDVGVAGPIAGFVALVPILIYGLAHSVPKPMAEFGTEGEPRVLLGMNLAISTGVRLLHGDLPRDFVVDLHPAALAAWVGLLATSLNLLPLGQLDGGHILYAAAGKWQRRLALPFWMVLLAAGFLWPAWWFWCLFVLIVGLKHPPVQDEWEPLNGWRRLLALAALLIFLASFMPAPIIVDLPH